MHQLWEAICCLCLLMLEVIAYLRLPLSYRALPLKYSAQPDHYPATLDNHIDHLAISLKWLGLPGTLWIVHSLICEQPVNPGLPHRVRECIPLYYGSMKNVTNYQSFIWKYAMEPVLNLTVPAGHNWVISDNTDTITHEFMLN